MSALSGVQKLCWLSDLAINCIHTNTWARLTPDRWEPQHQRQDVATGACRCPALNITKEPFPSQHFTGQNLLLYTTVWPTELHKITGREKATIRKHSIKLTLYVFKICCCISIFANKDFNVDMQYCPSEYIAHTPYTIWPQNCFWLTTG